MVRHASPRPVTTLRPKTSKPESPPGGFIHWQYWATPAGRCHESTRRRTMERYSGPPGAGRTAGGRIAVCRYSRAAKTIPPHRPAAALPMLIFPNGAGSTAAGSGGHAFVNSKPSRDG